jgi:hypothetical protein
MRHSGGFFGASVHLGLGCVLLLMGLAPAFGQTWIELTTVGGPSGDSFHGFAGTTVTYDASNNRLIVFLPRSGGCHSQGDLTSEVWVLTNANGLGGPPVWSQLATTGSPPPAIHYDSTAVYDETANQLVVYGGGWCHTSPALNGVFALTHANGLGGTPTWSLVNVTNASCFPYAQPGSCTGLHSRLGHSAVHDPVTDRMVVFGGHLAFFGTDQNDTRMLPAGSPSAWTTLAPAGDPPPIRTNHTAVYDSASDRMIVYGGLNLVKNYCCGFPSGNMADDYGDLWILTDASGIGVSTWLPQAPAGTVPPDRGSHSAVYDSANNRMLVFGGFNIVDFSAQTTMILGDLWELSNANGLTGTPTWTQLAQSGTAPGPLSSHGAVFDAANQRMIVMAAVPDASGMLVARLWVLSFTQAVEIDIKPGSFPNSINLTDRGLLPVAILGSAEFDVETIDPETINVAGVSLALRGSAKAPKLAYSYEDTNGDGFTDIMTFFDVQALVAEQVLTETTGALEISGSLYDGTSIKGMDSVNIVH